MRSALLTTFTALVAFALPLPAATLPAGFAETQLATGLDPTAMEFAPDGRIFILEKPGRVRIMKDEVLLAAPFITVAADNHNERGLSGITFDPDFASNGWVYLYYTVLDGTPNSETTNRVVRVTADPENPDLALPGETLIFELDTINAGNAVHMGGAMFFREGKLFIATGEAGVGSRSQSFTSMMGKVLRINPDGTIPTDNPFYNTATGNFRAIYALGLRNPFSFDIQPGSGKVYLNDVGGHTTSFEEINELAPGANYGWPTIQGIIATGQAAPAGYTDPVHAYPIGGHNSGFAIVGGVFYNPTSLGTGRFPDNHTGLYFFGDYVQRWIKTYNPGTGEMLDFSTGHHRPLTFRITPSGTLYMLTRGGVTDGSVGNNTGVDTGAVWKVFYTASDAPTIASAPQNTLTSVGEPASFSVSVSGAAPYEFRWQRNGADIPGATTISSSTTSTYTLDSAKLADHGAEFRCIVTNSGGSIDSPTAVLSVTSRPPPVVTITSPSADLLYSGGQIVNFSGFATDPEDGALDPANLTWRVDFHHDDHNHPGLPPTSGIPGGNFTISNLDHGTNVWYRIYLTATNSAGLSRTVFREIFPKFVDITLATRPPGLRVKLDSASHVTPYTYTGIAGMLRTLEVDSPQGLDGALHSFDSWSHGATASHGFVTPQTNATFTAWFNREQSGGITRDYWLSVPGTSVSQLTGLASFPGSPSGTDVVSSLAGPTNWADSYGARFHGFITPPSSGNYTFHLSASDEAEFWLSTSTDPAGAVRIANVHTDPHEGYEGFDYVVEPIVGKGTATEGWSGSWTGSGNVVASGLSYTDANGTSLPVVGNRIEVSGQSAFRSRSTGINSGTLWLSFIARSSVPGTGFAGVSLFEGTGERVFIGQRSNQTNWGFERTGGASANTSVSAGTETFLVCRIDFGAGAGDTTNAYLWVNPTLGATNEPALGSQSAQILNVAPFTFNNLRIASGSNSGAFRVDELRLGTGYQKVAPISVDASAGDSAPIPLQAGQSYYFEALHKAGIGPDHLAINWTGPGVSNAPVSGTALAPLYSAPVLTSYLGWRMTHFQGVLADESRSGFNASFLGDGIANGLKYALGMDPTVPGTAGLPQGTVEDGVLSLTYRRDNSLDIDYVVEASTALTSGSWSSEGVMETVPETEGNVQRVRAFIPMDSTSRKGFLRLKVQAPE